MLQKGSCVLVHSAAGGCGLNALAICFALGATPIGTVGSPDKVTILICSQQLRHTQAWACLGHLLILWMHPSNLPT